MYARGKQTLVRQQWKYTQNYADAKEKTAVIDEIMARARANCNLRLRPKLITGLTYADPYIWLRLFKTAAGRM